MKDHALAWSGLAYAAAILVGTLLALPSGLSEREMEWEPPSTYMPGIAQAQTSFVASMWVYLASSVALLALGLASRRPFVALFLGASGGAFLIETTAILAMGTAIAPRYVASSGADAASLETLAATVIAFRLPMALLASLLLAGAALAWGLGAWRDRSLPRWLAGLALVSGALGVLGGASLALEPFSLVRTVGIVLWTVFAGLVGVLALSGRARTDAQRAGNGRRA